MILSMYNGQIWQLKEYLEDFEEGLVEFDYDSRVIQTEYTALCRTIRMLMDETAKSKDQNTRVRLTCLEYKARQCKDCIERRTGIKN